MLPLCQTHVCPYEGPIIDAIALLYVSFKRFFRHAPASGWASCLHQEQFSSQAVGTMKRSLVPTSSPVAAGMNAADLQLIEQRAHNQIWPRGTQRRCGPCLSVQILHWVVTSCPRGCKSLVMGALHVGHTGSQVRTARSMQLRQKTSVSNMYLVILDRTLRIALMATCQKQNYSGRSLHSTEPADKNCRKQALQTSV
jgi:hypothetical protein